MTNWFRTFTDKAINPGDLKLEDICIEDIAHSLALTNRFNGHARYPLNVAQHSVFVSRLCGDGPNELQGLLHDGAETYCGDMLKWLKVMPQMAGFKELEQRIQKLIFQKYECPIEIQEDVEAADRLMVRFEGVKGYGPDFHINHPNYPDLTQAEFRRIGYWDPWTWEASEQIFLDTFRRLTRSR
jgi:uncharacterized protein